MLKCVKLIRSLCGLRDSPSNFNKGLVRFMTAAGFKQLECEKCIFYQLDEATKKFVLVGCEVDARYYRQRCYLYCSIQQEVYGRLQGHRLETNCVVPQR